MIEQDIIVNVIRMINKFISDEPKFWRKLQ